MINHLGKYGQMTEKILSPIGVPFGYQVVTSFAFGLAFSPFSKGLMFYIIFVVVWELYLFIVHATFKSRYPFLKRIIIIIIGFLGFIIGRYLTSDEKIFKMRYGPKYNFNRHEIAKSFHSSHCNDN